MKIELVIFDCDGVLVDSEPIANQILAEELSRMGLPTTYSGSMRFYMGKSEKDCLDLITEKLGGSPPPNLLKNYHSRTKIAFAEELKPVSGIAEALTRIPFAKCVGSSGSHQKIQTSLSQTGLKPFFKKHIFSASDVKRGKPHPDLFLYAAEKMKVTPDTCVVIEDSVPGVTAAKAAGMRVFGYAALTSAGKLKSAGAEEVFNNMRDLPELLQLNS